MPTPAGKVGLREGDVFHEVNKQPVHNAKDLVAASKKLNPNEKILIASRLYSGPQRLRRAGTKIESWGVAAVPAADFATQVGVLDSAQMSRRTLAFQPLSCFLTEKPWRVTALTSARC